MILYDVPLLDQRGTAVPQEYINLRSGVLALRVGTAVVKLHPNAALNAAVVHSRTKSVYEILQRCAVRNGTSVRRFALDTAMLHRYHDSIQL